MRAMQPYLTAPDAPWPRDLYDRIEAIK